MKLVPYPKNFRPSDKIFYCTQCNRFELSNGDYTPKCPVHGDTMVGSLTDPRMFESDAPIADIQRKPPVKRCYSSQDSVELHAKTADLDDLVRSHIHSNNQIPIVHNTEDSDIAYEAMMGLLARGYNVVIFMEEPRYLANGRLDPNWLYKFQPILENCDIAIYARRAGTIPNPATKKELDILTANSKTIVIYEY
jgi:hypothetical protein